MVKIKDKSWKVLKSEYLANKPWFTVRKEHIQLPTGKEIPDYYLYEYPNWVNIIAITKDKEFVLVSQYRHGIGYTALELCAGVCEDGESALISAQRELLEETGYGNGNWEKYMEISVNPGTHTNMTFCYLATDVEKIAEQHLDTTEDIDVHLLSLEELIEVLQKDEIKQAVQAAPLWKYIAENHLI
ncbi:MAG: NUDIX hydrolase [Dysgonomonas sp.]|nr:NUDIX hydrolase [Dysgonomonas sp.]